MSEAKGLCLSYISVQKLLIAFSFTIGGLLLGLFLTELVKGDDIIMQICFGVGSFVVMLLGLLLILEDSRVKQK